MAIETSSTTSVLCLLLLVLLTTGGSARKISRIRFKEVDDGIDTGHETVRINQGKDDHPHHHQSQHAHENHMGHMGSSSALFFTVDDLKEGKTMAASFYDKDPSTLPHLIPREEADSIPFSSSQLHYLFELFSLSEGSPRAKAVETTLAMCEREPVEGEIKFCATSLESMLDSIRANFGPDTHLRILTTNLLTKRTSPLPQNYTILEEPKEVSAPRMLSCHPMPYPYVVYLCHSQAGGSRIFEVRLGADSGDRVQALAVCHMGLTTRWDENHESLRLLDIEPGTAPAACHFFAPDDTTWVPESA